MMARQVLVCNEVLNDHARYVDIMIYPKGTSADGIKMELDATDRANTERGYLTFSSQCVDSGSLECRRNVGIPTRYSIKIFDKNFMPLPLFRFDSAGTTHTNPKNSSVPLLQKTVKIPHFQKFDSNGVCIAYRTYELEENEREILNDMDLGLNEFCIECNMTAPDGVKRPSVLRQLDIFSHFNEADPHTGGKFK